MALKGWYPDPGGTPGLFRFWDGQGWTSQSTSDPGSPEAPTPLPASAGQFVPPRKRTNRSLAAGLAILLILAVIGAFVVVRSNRQTADNEAVTTKPSQSVYDDSSPSESATLSPTPEDTPSSEPGQPPSADPSGDRPVECDGAKPDELGASANDGRVHGGPMSFAQLPDPWSQPGPTGRFFFSRDSYVQTLRMEEELPWQSSAQVGVVEFDDYPGSKTAATSMLQCLLTSDFYASVDVTLARNESKQIKIGSTSATQLDALLTFEHPQLKTKGSLVRIILIDSAPLTYYFHAVPQEGTYLVKVLDDATASLQVG